VLPMANNTNDLDGPDLVRGLLVQRMRQKGFEVIPPDQVDAALKVQGFTDGGQLAATTPVKIAEWTGAEGLLYSTLDDFNYVDVGFYWERKVEITGRLMGSDGGRLWEAQRYWSTKGIATSQQEAKRVFAEQLAVKAFEKMTHAPLKFESTRAVDSLLATLPSY